MVVRAVLFFIYLASLSQLLAAEDTTKVEAAEKSPPADKKDHATTKAKSPAKDTEAPAKETTTPAKVAKVPGSKSERKTTLEGNEVLTLPLRMPGVMTTVHDTYMMTPTKVDHDDAYIVGYVPQVLWVVFRLKLH